MNGAKPRGECDDGVWLGVWVACQGKCYIPSKSHRDLLRDPASLKDSRFFLAFRSKKLRLALAAFSEMTGYFFLVLSFLYYLFVIFNKVLYKWQKLCYTKHTTQIEYYRFTRMCFYFDKNACSPFCILVIWCRFVW